MSLRGVENLLRVHQKEKKKTTLNWLNALTIMPWNGVRAFMVGFFSLKYKLLNFYSDDSRCNISWEVFVCVREFTIFTASKYLFVYTTLQALAHLVFQIYVLLKLASSASKRYSFFCLWLFLTTWFKTMKY